MAIRRHVLLPTRGTLALRAAYLLLLPVHGELLKRIGPRDLHLPALTRARRTAQDDALLVATVDEQLRTNIGRIDEVFTRRQFFVNEGLLNGECALRLMHSSWRRMDVREEVGSGGLARFADMHHVAGPGRVAFVAVARLGIVGRFDALSGRRQCPIRLKLHAALSVSPFRYGLVLRPFVVALPCPTQALQDR